MSPSKTIKQKALAIGFDLCGVASAESDLHTEALTRWLRAGFHGDMGWMERGLEKRRAPTLVLPGVRSMIVVGYHYYTEGPPPEIADDPLRGRIASYAWGPDYHDVLLPKLRDLEVFIRQEIFPGCLTRAYTDTGPILERDWAHNAGLGQIGRNTCLIHPDYGSYLLLGIILCEREIEPDKAPVLDICHRCTRCLKCCPTHAIKEGRLLDSRACISYLTIEQKESIPESWRPFLGNRIFGCDECQRCCPWVKKQLPPRPDNFLRFEPEIHAPILAELLEWSDEQFRERYRKTPLYRTGLRRLQRNAVVALGNAGCREAAPPLKKATTSSDALIRDHAEWALRQYDLF